MGNRDSRRTCSFCGKRQHEVARLIAGPDVNICDECIQLCNGLLVQESTTSADSKAQAHGLKVPKPHEIFETLNEYVIGHEETKKVLSVAVHNHYKRLRQSVHFKEGDPLYDVDIEKSNILMLGPTGSG